jgi:uncharacterized membrane protein
MNTKKETNKLDVGSLFSQAWEIYKENWLNFIIIGLIFAVVGGIGNFGAVDFSQSAEKVISNGHGLLKVIGWLATTYLSIGYIRYLFNLIDGKKAKVEEIFHGVDSISHFVFVIVVGVITGIIIIFGTLLFIIPGVIAALGLIFSKYVIVENKGGEVEIIEAIKTSWEITKGYRGRLLWISVVLAFLNLFGFLALIVGLIITIPLSAIIMASAYKKLS